MIILIIIYFIILLAVIILAKTDKQEVWEKRDVMLLVVPIVHILILLCLLKFRLDVYIDKFLAWMNKGKEQCGNQDNL